MTATHDAVEVPATAAAPWVERLLWVFMISFAFDYRASQAREASAFDPGSCV